MKDMLKKLLLKYDLAFYCHQTGTINERGRNTLGIGVQWTMDILDGTTRYQ